MTTEVLRQGYLKKSPRIEEGAATYKVRLVELSFATYYFFSILKKTIMMSKGAVDYLRESAWMDTPATRSLQFNCCTLHPVLGRSMH